MTYTVSSGTLNPSIPSPTIRAAKFRDGHRHYHKLAEHRACAHAETAGTDITLLTLTEAYTPAFSVFKGE